MIREDAYVSQTTRSWRPIIAWLLVAGTALLFPILVFVAPVAAATNHPDLALSIYKPFGALCHQLPERSFFIAGHKLAVCARCTGLYVGFAVTALCYPLVRQLRLTTTPEPRWLLLAAVPMAIDFSLTLFGIWENTHLSRLFTGLLLGGVAVPYVIPGFVELSLRGLSPLKPSPHSQLTTSSVEAIAAASSDYSAPHRRIS